MIKAYFLHLYIEIQTCNKLFGTQSGANQVHKLLTRHRIVFVLQEHITGRPYYRGRSPVNRGGNCGNHR
jgi:hypothetical protein